MKRLAIVLVLGLLALNLVRRGPSERHHRGHEDRHGGDYRVVVALGPDCHDEDCDDPSCRHAARTIYVRRGGENRAAVVVGPAAAITPVVVSDEPPAPPAPPTPPHARPLAGIGREVREGIEDGLRGFEEGFGEGVRGLEEGLERAKAAGGRAESRRSVAVKVRAKSKAAQGPEAPAVRTVEGRVSATEDRARDDARGQLRKAVAAWLEPDVPADWGRLERESERLVEETRVRPEAWDFGLPEKSLMYRATVRADFSDRNRAEIVERYHREVVAARLVKLGGGLGFALVCLGALAGYIRADEATRGYYTNRLRLLAAAGVGAAGVAIYKMMA